MSQTEDEQCVTTSNRNQLLTVHVVSNRCRQRVATRDGPPEQLPTVRIERLEVAFSTPHEHQICRRGQHTTIDDVVSLPFPHVLARKGIDGQNGTRPNFLCPRVDMSSADRWRFRDTTDQAAVATARIGLPRCVLDGS